MDIDTKAIETVEKLKSITVIGSNDDYQRAAELWKEGKATIKAIEEKHNDDIEFAHREHKRLIALKKEVLAPVEEETKRIKQLMAYWDMEQERKRIELRLKLEEESRKREEERKLAEAIAAERNGDTVNAEAILEEVVTVPPVHVPKETPKIEGVVYRTIWKFRIVNQSEIPREYLLVDEKKIGNVVRASKGTISIPGIEVYTERV